MKLDNEPGLWASLTATCELPAVTAGLSDSRC
jgi:hypothetical protein